MEISGSFVLQAPMDRTWDFLLDIERVGACMPGMESVEPLDERRYRGTLKAQVGPIKARFSGVAELTEVEPQSHLTASIEGDDKTSATSVKGQFKASLTEVDRGTRVEYTMDITLRGRLAQFGAPVFRAVAKKMTDEFVSCLQDSMNGSQA